MIWFISGLSMLFGAMMLMYFIIRSSRAADVGFGTLHLPRLLLLSTALVLTASATVQLAVIAIRRERQDLMRAWLLVTLFVGIAFCAVQVPSLGSLFHRHLEIVRVHTMAGGNANNLMGVNPFFGIIAVFILVHALHVLGGIVQLGLVTHGAFTGKYDHEYYNPVKHSALYWHFLDVVWLAMYGMMVLAG
jgi:heme/copper-type cytochrome/quinol oxidase subunit 3